MSKASKPKSRPLLELDESRREDLSLDCFLHLLRHPLLKSDLPGDFDCEEEAKHLSKMCSELPKLRDYNFEQFIHSGGSGMVFKVSPVSEHSKKYALKIARSAMLMGASENHVEFSPVSEREIKALYAVNHSNLVQLIDAIPYKSGVIAIVTSYVDNPRPLDEFLREILSTDPDPSRKRGIKSFSPERLDNACAFLVEKFAEISSAVEHMHSLEYFHFDIKPANILVSMVDKKAVLTDLGSCIQCKGGSKAENVRVNFTWTYAHPDLHSLTRKPQNITGGLKVSAEVATDQKVNVYDLFAFGRTIQHSLAILVEEFGERCFSAYGFRYLHIISCLLLDGHNGVSVEGYVVSRDSVEFVSDTALDYHVSFFKSHKIKSAKDLCKKIARFSRQYSWYSDVPEMDPYQADVVNTGLGMLSPFTVRVASILGHPVVRRLKSEFQLGWMRELYPGATHNRWSHTIGVFSAMVQYYNSLLSDTDVPTLRIITSRSDVEHAMIAALLHDIGQADFAHDFEAACPELFNHESIAEKMLDEKYWDGPTLREVITKYWPRINFDRIFCILTMHSAEGGRRHAICERSISIDGIAADIIDGPVDADKFDYLARDSVACGVSYGLGIDRSRFLRSLSVSVKQETWGSRLALAYRAKGSAAVESLLLARYQMYGAVYWHHTYRCIQSMFTHAVASVFGGLPNSNKKKLRGKLIGAKTISSMIYHRVVCGKTLKACVAELGITNLPDNFLVDFDPAVVNEKALDLIWRFADDSNRELLQRLASRQLYKRVYELKIGDIEGGIEYSAVKQALLPLNRLSISSKICETLMDSVHTAMQNKKGAATATITEFEARSRHDELQKAKYPLVVIDFPTRGIPDERNFPEELADPARKYISGFGKKSSTRKTAFHSVKEMQIRSTCFRVFAEPKLHELVVRYLNPDTVRRCVESCIPIFKDRI